MNLLYDILVYEADYGQIIMLALSALEHLLKYLPDSKKIFISLGGVDVLEKLQINHFYEVFVASKDIMEQYFDGE